MKTRKLGALFCTLVGAFLSLTPLHAQTVPTLSALSIERVVSLSNIFTTLSPTIPASTLAGFTSGALELRERIIYDPQGPTVTSTLFAVAAGSPIPTPISTDITAATVAVIVTNVASITATGKPLPSVQITGTVSQGATPYGSVTGALYTLSLGYSFDTPPVVSDVVEVAAGAVGIYSPAASGTITVTQPSSGGGGGGGGTTNNPTIVLNPATQQTTVKQIRLDASGSTDPMGLALTFAWIAVGNPYASILDPSSATPDVQFVGGYGLYTFKVTVTDSAGNSSTANATVMYLGH